MSDIESIKIVSITHAGSLTIAVEGGVAPPFTKFEIVFNKCFGYRSLLEEYRLEEWKGVPKSPRLGWTRIVEDSPWVRDLSATEPMFSAHGGSGALHFMVCSEDWVIDVLTTTEPVVRPMA